MVLPSEKVLAGVSGGADSVCLLFLLLAYAEKVPFSLAVVHVDHGLRAEAGEDARFVEELCRSNGVPFFLEKADVRGLAQEEKLSLEDAGRRARYEAFGRVAAKLGAAKAAVAHNSDDNAETMLFNLFRGSGMKGLCGIAPVRRDAALEIIRPILCLERGQVEAYLGERGMPWRTDHTNGGDGYTRNRIRHHILPYAEREVARGAVGHMRRTADLLRETESYLEEQTKEALGRCLAPSSDVCRREVDIDAFLACHGALQKRMLLALAKGLSPTGKDISWVHIRDALTLFREEGNRGVSLPFGVTARRQYGKVILEGEQGVAPAWHGGPVAVSLKGEILDAPLVYDLDSLGRIEFTAFFVKKGREVPKNQYTKWFDYDKIDESVVIRSRRQGDYFTISDGVGNMRHKSLKDYMITEKIPRRLRDSIPLVAAGNHVLWLVGWRISEYFKVDGNTERILQMRFLLPGQRDGGENVGTH